ncbi:MAG: AsmA-like C-terminal domain-containing protein [Alphaproteobacteria bacterium]
MFHRVALFVLEGLIVLAFAAIAAAGLGAWRLSDGPVSMGFLRPLLDQAVEEALPGYAVELEDVQLAWAGWERGLDVRAIGLRIDGPRGGKVAEFAEASISLSSEALLRGRIAPARIKVAGPLLRLERGDDGVVRVAGEASGAHPLAEALRPRADGGAGRVEATTLVEILVEGAELEFVDLPSRTVWRARDASIQVSRLQGATRVDSAMTLVRREREVRLAASARQVAGDPRTAVEVFFTGVAPALVADFAADFVAGAERLSGFDLPLDGSIAIGIDGAGKILDASLSVSSPGGRLSDPALFPGAAEISGAGARLSYEPATRRLRIPDAHLLLPGGGRVAFAGDGALHADGPSLAGRVRIASVTVDSVSRYWPLPIAPMARRWIVANLSAGVVDEAVLDLSLEPAPGQPDRLGAFSGAVSFRGVTVAYLPGMPKVSGVEGSATLSLQKVEVAVHSGSVGALRVDEARALLTALDTDTEMADIRVAVRGPLRDQLQLIDHQPLGLMRQVAMSPADFGGEATTRARFVFPLADNLKVEQVSVSGTAEAKGFSLRRAALGQDARDGEIAARFDDKGLSAAGKLVFGRTPVEVDYALGFQPSNPVRERIRASGTLPSGELAVLGFDVSPHVEGPLPLALEFVARRNGASELRLDAGLERAKLAVPDLSWEKPAGVAGSARLELAIQRGRVQEIRNLRIAVGDADIAGRVSIGADGRTIQGVDLERFRVGRTNARLAAAREGQGWRVRLTGAALDLSDAEVGGPASAPDPARPRLSVEAQLGRVWLAPDRAITGVSFRGERGARWERAQLAATGADRHGREDRFSFDLSTDPSGRARLQGRSANAGATLNALGITDKVVGGELEVSGASDMSLPGKPLAIEARVRDYRLVDEPAVARFLAAALLTGILDTLRGEGLGFDRAEARGLLRDGELEIRDLRTSGPALGIQARGRIDLDGDRIDLEGTIVPANAINSLFGKIPVLGEILFGPGLFAARYTLKGPRANPEVAINPLSALAPGVLRNIFGIFEGGTPPTTASPPSGSEGR